MIDITILRVNGTRETHSVAKRTAMEWIERMIAADGLDTVNLRDGRVMLVDDSGYETEEVKRPARGDEFGGSLKPGDEVIELRPIRARKPVNAEATKLYHAVCRPGTTHQVVGDVAIARDADFA